MLGKEQIFSKTSYTTTKREREMEGERANILEDIRHEHYNQNGASEKMREKICLADMEIATVLYYDSAAVVPRDGDQSIIDFLPWA